MASNRIRICVVAAAFLAGCGGASQSLPGQGPKSVQAGFMRVTFHVAGPLDFARYQYEIVLNTSGNGSTPEFGPHGTWAGYSDAIRTAVTKQGAYAEVIQYVPNKNPHLPPSQVVLGVTPATFQFNANGNGANTAFTVTFERSILSANNLKITNTWQFNAAVFRAQNIADSMGNCATCFRSPELKVTTMFDETIDAALSSAPPSARIVDVQLANEP